MACSRKRVQAGQVMLRDEALSRNTRQRSDGEWPLLLHEAGSRAITTAPPRFGVKRAWATDEAL